MNAFIAILRKDLTLELRGGHITLALVILSLLILIVMVFASATIRGAEPAAAALWVALVFSGTVGASRALLGESRNGCIRALVLSPIDHATLYAAKLAASFILMGVAECGAITLMVLFFNLDFDARLLRLAPVILLGALGFAALATLLASVAERTRAGDLILPLLVVPIFVPALIAGVKASSAALAGASMAELVNWLGILIAFDAIFVAAGYLLFEHVIGED